jgi:hypothetical protein
VDALGLSVCEEPAVVVRLLLMAVDEASRERRLVSSLLRKISLPLALAKPGVKMRSTSIEKGANSRRRTSSGMRLTGSASSTLSGRWPMMPACWLTHSSVQRKE